MTQKPIRQINISLQVAVELERRKDIISRQIGKKVGYDAVIRNLLGWR